MWQHNAGPQDLEQQLRPQLCRTAGCNSGPNDGLAADVAQVTPMDTDTEWVYGGGRRQKSGQRERSLSVSSSGSRRSSLNEIRLQRTSSSAMASTQPSQ